MLLGVQMKAQNSNVVSAALEFKKYTPALFTGNVDEAKEAIMNAKEFIDPAMKHESTKDDEKAHYYNAVIYFGLLELSGLEGNEDLKDFQNEETMDMIKESMLIAYNSRKYKRDVEDFIDQRVQLANMSGKAAFDKGDYKTAYQGFAGAYELQKMIGVEDEEMKTNALISAKNAVATMKKSGEAEEALEFIESTREMFPKNAVLAIEGVNIALDNGDMDRAEEFFNTAAEANPENEVLFSSMGSIYLSSADKAYAELNEMEVTDDGYPEKAAKVEELYKKAEDNLKKALEINPEFLDAAYNLGVLYLGRGEKLSLKASQMDFNDPQYEPTMKKSEEMYKNAIAPLEVYIKQEPNSVGVLTVLFQVHRKVGNVEKFKEYKQRAEEAAAAQEGGGEDGE
ncbi:MAG: hypothetical protein COA32_11975 [Fluviicola sp.]|nr:MAG: hypothetical protein COA32_11975 [Fluviicola sp.]